MNIKEIISPTVEDIPRIKCNHCSKIVSSPAGANNTEHSRFCYHVFVESKTGPQFLIATPYEENAKQTAEMMKVHGKTWIKRCDGGMV